MKRKLILEDGTVYHGVALGSDNFKIGEIIFNTAMSGYQEVLSDPSYYGQMVVMTYPLIGNYGINHQDFESMNVSAFGLIVNEACEYESHYQSKISLDQFMKLKGVAGISGIDTRHLTKKIRDFGSMKAMMCDDSVCDLEIIEKLKNEDAITNHVSQVATKQAFQIKGSGARVVVVDFGVKQGIIDELTKRNCDILVVPYTYCAKEILALYPQGIVFSNGPGDPKDVINGQVLIKELLGKVAIFGICLGHQLLSLACGGDTVKLKYGHHGINHPVLNIAKKQVYITSQNHSYAVDEESLKGTDLQVSYRNINDQSVEGLIHKKFKAFSVQFHPEAHPGPVDANDIFDDFIALMKMEEQ